METREVTFKQFGKDYKEYYHCKEVFVSDFSDAEEVMSDLYDTTDFEFDYERRIVELYY